MSQSYQVVVQMVKDELAKGADQVVSRFGFVQVGAGIRLVYQGLEQGESWLQGGERLGTGKATSHHTESETG